MKLKDKLQKDGMKDITYLVVNMDIAARQIGRLRKIVDFKVYQDKTGDIWKKLKGGKDDFFIYDRCGKLSEYVPFHRSYLRYPHVEKAIRDAYNNKHACKESCKKTMVGTKKAQECPPDEMVLKCIISPCMTAKCDAFPDAKCQANYCQPCTAEFYVGDKKVNCQKKMKVKN